MNIKELGYNSDIKAKTENKLMQDFTLGRVVAEHKERYLVGTNDGTIEAEVTGNIRYTANSRNDFPAVGDWVALLIYDSNLALIQHIIPRKNALSRKAAGHSTEKQLIASNIDEAFILQSVDRDFSINRIERYLTICDSSNIKPLIILTKTDLVSRDQLNEYTRLINERITNIRLITISNETKNGYETLTEVIQKGKTYCLLGSSGVGKSSLVNNLAGDSIMKTDNISTYSERGQHVTTHRELIILKNGGILIDNPGMREVGLTDSSNGLSTAFDLIRSMTNNCKFKNCKHINEPGCVVIEAVKQGKINKSTYENYLKIEREKEHFEASLAEKRKKDKQLGKVVKGYKKMKKNNQL